MEHSRSSQNGSWFRVLFILFVGFTTAACATQGKTYAPVQPPSDHGLIYIYRPWAFQGSAGNLRFVANRVHELKLANAGYCVYEAKPGNLTLSSTKQLFGPDFDFITIYVEAGEVYFVRATIANPFSVERSKIPIRMELVDRASGEAEIRALKITE